MFVVLCGNLSDGFKARGPFSSRDKASIWAEPLHTEEDTWVATMKPGPVAQPLDGHCEPHILMCGNLAEGFEIVGPFADFDEADWFSNKFRSGPTWIMPLEKP